MAVIKEVDHIQRRIAVSPDLAPVRQALADAGYRVVDMDNVQTADAVVVSGGSDNLMGMQDIKTKAPVIDGDGRTANEVLEEIKKRIH